MENEYFSSINDVSKKLGVPAYTLRYWEKQFPGAIRPTTGAGGRRYYRAETVQKIEKIKSLLYIQGMTIAGVKKMMRDGNFGETTVAKDVKPAIQPTIATSAPINSDQVDTVITLLRSARDLLQ